MQIDVHHHIHFDGAVLSVLDDISRKQDLIIGKLGSEKIMLDQIITNVAAETTLESSIETLLNGISAKLLAAGQDPAKLAALNTAILTNVSNLQAAITANTPAA